MIYRTGLAAMVVAGMMSLAAAAPAAAQGTLNPQPTQGAADSCPKGWSNTEGGRRTKTCRPLPGAKAAYYPQTGRNCATGYIKSGIFCVEGQPITVTATAGSVKKANPLDRCPVGYFTDPGNGHMCTSLAAAPPVIRLKGEGACAAGELEDWGVWCVANYEGLTRKDAAKGYPDHNGIYQTSFKTTGKQQASRMADLPEGKEYTPAYFLIFGRVDRDGNPLPGGAGAGVGAAVNGTANTGNPVAAATDAAKAECKVPAPAKKRGLGGLGAALNQAVAAVAGEAGC